DRHQHEAGRGDAEVRLEHRRRVRRDERDAVKMLEAAATKLRGQPVRTLLELLVRVTPLAVHDRDLVGIDVGAAAQERDRRELRAEGIALLRHGGHCLGVSAHLEPPADQYTGAAWM